MKTILISVIGNRPYNHTVYNLSGKNYETDFFFIPLIEHFKPDQFYLLGTKDSIWDKVDEAAEKNGFEYIKQEIPFGKNDEELWKIFETIISLPLSECEIVFDITHGFRAIPFAAFLALIFFKSVRKDIQIKNVLYGNYEARDKEKNLAPVVELSSYLEMLDWIRAAQRFVDYGDGDLLINKLETENDNGQLDQWLEKLKDFTANLNLNFVSQISTVADELRKTETEGLNVILKTIPTYRLLKNVINNRIGMFTDNVHDWQMQWRIADWYFKNHQYSQAIIVLRETINSFTCNFLGWNSKKMHDREKKASYLHYYLVNYDNQKVLTKKMNETDANEVKTKAEYLRSKISEEYFSKWMNLIDDITETRNQIGHGLIRNNNKNGFTDAREEIKIIERLIKDSETVFNWLNGLNDSRKDEIKKILKDIFKTGAGYKKKRVFIIVNEGIHPVTEDLKRQYGDDIKYEIVSTGNVELNDETKIAQKVKTIVIKYSGFEFYIVPSGLPYIITTVYNTILQVTSTHPVYLQFNRKTKKYEEKKLDPRKLIV